MNVCIIVDDYLPDSTRVSSKMMHELALEFKKLGHEVLVITPSSKLKEKFIIDNLDGIKICRFKNGQIKDVGKIKRALNETMLSFNAWFRCKKFFKSQKFDLIVYYSPSIFFGFLVSKLRKIWGSRTYLILRDIFPRWAIDSGMIKQDSLIHRYFRFFELYSYKQADTIGLMSKKNIDIFNIDNKKYNFNLKILRNWASNTPVKNKNLYKKKFGLKNKIVYFYGGNMGHAQDMMNIVRLAKSMVPYEKAHFLLIGQGDEYELIEKTILNENIKNITIMSSVDQDTFKEILTECDVGLFTLNKNHTMHNFPGKLLGYMVQSKPILGSINPNNDLKDILKSYNAGLVSINGEDDKFLENAVKLMDDNYRNYIGQNANKLLHKEFSVESATRNILSSY